MNKKYIVFVIILGGIIIIYLFFYNSKNETYNINLIEENLMINNVSGTEEIKNNKIKIHITGEVNTQGIIEIDEGGRIADAIEAAGGITLKADLTKVNLAYVLEDGQKLYIPSVDEQNFVEIQDDSGENVIVNSENKTGKININKASEEELQKITGVGPSLASKIIQYREENGKFKEVEDLNNVSGIGEKKFESIKKYVCVK